MDAREYFAESIMNSVSLRVFMDSIKKFIEDTIEVYGELDGEIEIRFTAYMAGGVGVKIDLDE